MELVGLTFVVSFVASALSGIGGGGGGFILTPYFILVGLSPQQAVATGKLSGLGVAFGSLTAFRGKNFVDRRLIWPLVIITTATSVTAAMLLPKIDATIFRHIIGVLLVVLIPTLFINKKALQPGPRTTKVVAAGYVVYASVAFTQAMFGTGLAILLTLDLMFLFGLGAMQANATKRVAQAAQAVIMFVLLMLQGLVVFTHGVAGLVGSSIGSHVGSHIAIKKGSRFIKIVLAFLMVASAIALLLP
jgi:uncharacterized membrane protein YfcA